LRKWSATLSPFPKLLLGAAEALRIMTRPPVTDNRIERQVMMVIKVDRFVLFILITFSYPPAFKPAARSHDNSGQNPLGNVCANIVEGTKVLMTLEVK
jgi:hypothetical protein